MTQSDESSLISLTDEPLVVDLNARRQRRRRRIRSTTSNGSGDVIVIDSPAEVSNPVAPRRRRRQRRSNGDSVVDLTCNDSVELVDLTTPASLIRPPLNRTQKRTDAAGLITTTSAPRQDLHSHEDTSPILKLNCPVCLEPLHSVIRAGRKICSTVCGHIFCRSCIKQAVRTCKKCPTCRKKLTEKGFHDIFLPIS